MWSVLFNYNSNLPQNSFIIDVLSVFMFVLASINYCVLFGELQEENISLSYTIFSCVLISYPLMLEIWEYTGANLNVCIGYLLVSVTLLLMQEQVKLGEWREALACGNFYFTDDFGVWRI
ncbi:MAG: hypothetical protein ACLSB9_15955 [Hydrogeniiclostridium mannosilyticum]